MPVLPFRLDLQLNLTEEGDVMRKRAAAISGVLIALIAATAFAQETKKEETGKALAYDSKKGNCLACHSMPGEADAEQPGNSGPPLIAMQARFPDKAVLRARIWDEMAFNPQTIMPPVGKHKVLTEQELDKVVDFIYGL
jgi:sulfur-oxidizing protein SoxX